MSDTNRPHAPSSIPLPQSPSLDAVVAAAKRDAIESGYVACRRHLIMAVLCAPEIEKCLPGLGEHRLAALKRQAALATNMTLDKTLFPRRPNHDFGRSALFDAALRDAAQRAADVGAVCFCPSHLLEELIKSPSMDEDGIDPNFWDWNGVTVAHSTGCV